ncbi:MAG: hypothetical protein ABIM42_07745 [candidate division WOR-3 bacterium]
MMKISRRGLEFISIDDNNMCLANAFISRKVFHKWKVFKESYASINLDFLKKIFSSDTLIEEIKQNNESEIEIFVKKPLEMFLLIQSRLEYENVNTQIKHIIGGATFFEATLPSKDLMILLKKIRQACDEISFYINNGKILCLANFLNFSVLKTLTGDVTTVKFKNLKFSIPMKYFSAILPALSLSSKLKISLTEQGVMKALLLLNGGKYKLSLFISSRIEHDE